MKKIRTLLRGTGYLPEIMAIVGQILAEPNDPPIAPVVIEWKNEYTSMCNTRLRIEDVRVGVIQWLKAIEYTRYGEYVNKKSLNSFYVLIEHRMRNEAYKYAIFHSHRMENRVDIEQIRAYLCLLRSIEYFVMGNYDEDPDYRFGYEGHQEFTIPDGWKKK